MSLHVHLIMLGATMLGFGGLACIIAGIAILIEREPEYDPYEYHPPPARRRS
jgi:hypothetical protein